MAEINGTPKFPELFVTIDSEKILAKRPKFGLFKKVLRVNKINQDDPDGFETEAGLDILFQLIVDIFNTDELTMDNIEEVDLDSFVNLQDINDWIKAYVPEKKVQEMTEVEAMKSNLAQKKTPTAKKS